MVHDEVNLPDIVVHADWSVRPGKRWMAHGTRQSDGGYLAHAPQPVGGPATLLYRLRSWAGPRGVVLAGFDFPIGLPFHYARAVGVDDFVALLPRLGGGEWESFYRVAERAEEIGLHRPFYPQRPGGAERRHLVEGPGVQHFGELRRICERGGRGRPEAAPLFWTLGAKQVGKAAISGWRDMLAPALRDPALDVALWPFSGALRTLLQRGRVVVAETYPAEYYDRLGIPLPTRKGRQAFRAMATRALHAWLKRREIDVTLALAEAAEAGYGEGADGEDRFDAVVGLLGMLDILLGGRPPGAPRDERIGRVEGWILGRAQGQASGEPEAARTPEGAAIQPRRPSRS